MKETLKIPRSEGVTDAERYLKRLCDRSFLSMWSYAGVFNDKSNGQEVCDLLVVFDNHLIIFSDKDCEYPNTGNAELDWKRWYKKSVKKSADQVYGAERWVLNHPDRLFLDQTCKIPFPIDLPLSDTVKVHRIVVAHSASAKCKEHFGGSGSLIVDSGVLGDEAIFRIGQINSEKGFVHIFDDTTLDIILDTLDTVSDFVDYLSRKEKFLTGDLKISSAGEEELLALYLKHTNENNEHDFMFDEDISSFGAICLDEGFWEDFSRSSQRKLQIEANRSSYFWDWLIESFTHHFRNGTSHFNTYEILRDQEKLLRLLAKENRTRRRFLSNAFLEFVGKVNPALKASRIILPQKENEPHYVFLVLPETSDISHEEYRTMRRELLLAHCLITKLDFANAKDLVGIATESGRANKGSEDLIYYDARIWLDKDRKNAEKLKSDFIRAGIINPQHRFERTEYEYPSLNESEEIRHKTVVKGKHLNKPCRCGSGKKTKKCCGVNN